MAAAAVKDEENVSNGRPTYVCVCMKHILGGDEDEWRLFMRADVQEWHKALFDYNTAQ